MLIGLDVDGTMLREDATMSEAVRDAIRAASETHDVVISTGRSLISTWPVLEILGIRHGYCVCSNGALVVQLDPSCESGFTVLQAETFDPVPILEKLAQHSPRVRVAIERLGRPFAVCPLFPEEDLGAPQELLDWDDLPREPTIRMVLRDPDGTLEDLVAIAETLGAPRLMYAPGWKAWVDVNPDGVSKAYGLEALRRHLGTDIADTLCVGDEMNDLEMLRWAGRGVAMGQARAEVVDAADEVTGSIHEDGLAQVLRAVL